MNANKIFCLLLFSTAINASNMLNSISPDLYLNGYVDASSNYLFRNNRFSSGTYNRTYDINPNGMSLQQASLSLSYDPQEGLGGLINPVVGRDPIIFAPYGWDSDLTDDRIGLVLLQAYLQYKAKNYTIIGGQLINSANYESPVSTQVRHFSRSILWTFATPATNFGIQGSYHLNDLLSISAGFNNGWDNMKDFSRPLTLMFGFNLTPNRWGSLIMSVFSGGQRATDRVDSGTIGRRTLVDIIMTLNLTDQLKLAANYDYDIQTKANLPNGQLAEAIWHGIAGYIDYEINQDWWLSLRAEVFSDRDGFSTGVAQTWNETTLTVGYVLTKNLEFRAETRHDFSNKKSFVTTEDHNLVHTQHSVALQGLYKF